MLWRLRNTLQQFMIGRYGTDKLNSFLMGLYLVLWLISLFVRGAVAGAVLYVLTVALVVTVFFRMLSRNIPRRQAENERFLRWWPGVTGWCRRQWHRLRDIRRWRYRRCPYCKAPLRLPIRRGRRTVTCSRCHSPFKTFIL